MLSADILAEGVMGTLPLLMLLLLLLLLCKGGAGTEECV